MKRKTNRPPERIPEPANMTLPSKDYQPNKAELEEEIDMPELSLEQAKAAFFRPFRIERDK